jgi:peptidyl-prolyl cis-trans isomerase-like protein 2
LPWIKKHGHSPATGKPINATDLVTLHFHKNEATGSWQDPVSFKAFNDSTHLVAIATSGNVFAFDTVQQLNVKAKFWSDLLTGETFTRKDLITLQDPNNVSGRSIANLFHLKQGLELTAADKGEQENKEEVNVAATGSASSLLKKIREQTEDAKKAKTQAGDAALEKMKRAAVEASSSSATGNAMASSSSTARHVGTGTTGKTSASFTSTGLTPSTKMEREVINEEDMMYEDIKKGQKGKGPYKGYVRMVTNFGQYETAQGHRNLPPLKKLTFQSLQVLSTWSFTVTRRQRHVTTFSHCVRAEPTPRLPSIAIFQASWFKEETPQAPVGEENRCGVSLSQMSSQRRARIVTLLEA